MADRRSDPRHHPALHILAVTDLSGPSELPEKDEDLRRQVVAMMPALRAFARSLTRNRATADDLIQETLLKALLNGGKFAADTNLRAWLFTILRNTFYSGIRRARNEIADSSGALAANLSVRPAQEGIVALQELGIALQRLPQQQRVALMLVGATGLPYGEAASLCGCAPGTIKSRVSRGRNRLIEIMQYEYLDHPAR